MPCSLVFCFSSARCIEIFRRRKMGLNVVPTDHGDDNEEEVPSVECYAGCTQVGAPVFHSTTRDDKAQKPEWEASAGSSLVSIHNRIGSELSENRSTTTKQNRELGGGGFFGKILDPRSKIVQKWNRAFLLARGIALAIDPLFFYALSIGQGDSPCLRFDRELAAVVTGIRTIVDAVFLYHLWLQFRIAYVSRESLVVGNGKLVWNGRSIAARYLGSIEGFWFDVFVILPIPQAIFWSVVPRLVKEEEIKELTIVLILILFFQYIPKLFHALSLIRRMQKVPGYIFGTIWWDFGLNLFAYFIASHVSGGCWYILAIQRVASCLRQQCERSGSSCNLFLSCSEEICHQFMLPSGTIGNPCSANSTAGNKKPLCLDINGPFRYGIYKLALPVISSQHLYEKILYPIYWGLISLSTIANVLEPTSNGVEVVFSICLTIIGLMLFTMLIGNIQMLLHAVMSRKRKMQLRYRDIEWWMSRRQLPSPLRQRVRHYECQSWASISGEEEMEIIKDLPDGLRRDIKRFLCLDLVKKVPIFQNMDDVILDNICDRVTPLVFSQHEKIIREGDPVQRMIFIVRGKVKSSQKLSKGVVATSILEPGGFFGDELLSWCLHRPFIDRLPASSATFTCIESMEAFSIDAKDLRYITDHFRYEFNNNRLKRTARYYSSNWRTWGAINIQVAWRRYRQQTRDSVSRRVHTNGNEDSRLRHYAAMFMSIRPHDHLE